MVNFPQLIAKELADSGISPDVLAANVQIVPDLTVDPITREVTGTPIASALNWTFTRFGHSAKAETWAALFIGADGQCWQAKVFGADGTPDGRSGRYLAPRGIGDVPFIPTIPDRPAAAIAESAGLLPEWELAKSAGADFWEWALATPQLPLVVTEGAKKALALVSQGVLAIAVYGCECGRDGLGKVKPALAPYINRPVTIAFDQDSKRTTRRKVTRATRRLGKALAAAGATVFIASWDGAQGKGIDDFLSHDPAAALAAIDGALSFQTWRLGHLANIDPSAVTATLNQRYLGALPIPDGAQTVFIRSPKGTGKTESISAYLDSLPSHTPRIVLTHRIQLGTELGRRLGVPYRTELGNTPEGSALGYCLCVDSLHPGAAPPFRPADWAGNPPVLVIDECEQVLWHILNSPTCQEHRAAILKTLAELFQIATVVICADADLSPQSLEYFSGLRDDLDPVVIVNQFTRETPRDLFLYPTPEALLSAAVDAISAGKRVIIHTGGQAIKSTFGTQNLEAVLKSIFPALKIGRIDRESVAEPGHPAQGAMANLNQWITGYDVVIASPTMETGVSIDAQYFDAVFYFGNGLQTVGAVGQTLERVRDDVPRYCYFPEFSRERIGNGADEPYSLKRSQQRQFKQNLSLLGKADSFADIDGADGRNLDTWCNMASLENYNFKNYRETILQNLLADGYRLTEMPSPDNAQDARDLAKALAMTNYQIDCEETAKAPIISPPELRRLNDKREKTKTERQTAKASSVSHRYETDDLTAELIAADDAGLYPQLRLHYFLTLGLEFLGDRDRRSLESKFPGAVGFAPDVNSAVLSLKIQTLLFLNICQFLDPDAVFTNESLGDWAQTVLAARADLRALLGTSFDPARHTPIACAARLLRLLGLRLECFERRRVKSDGETGPGRITRFYRLAAPSDPMDRGELFKRWEQRDLSRLGCATAPQDKECSPAWTQTQAA